MINKIFSFTVQEKICKFSVQGSFLKKNKILDIQKIVGKLVKED